MKYMIPKLPFSIDPETKAVLKLAKAHQALAELKGVAGIIPNQSILVNTLSLQEAKDSSAIENVITAHITVSLPTIKRGRLSLFVATSIFAAFCVVAPKRLAAAFPAGKIPTF